MTDQQFFDKVCDLRDAVVRGGVPTFLTTNVKELAHYCGIYFDAKTSNVRFIISQILASANLDLNVREEIEWLDELCDKNK